MCIDLLNKAQQLEKDGLIWEASEAYKDTLLALNTSKGKNNEKGLCKRKIKELNGLRENDFHTSSFLYEFTDNQKGEVNNLIERIVNSDNPLYLIGHTKSLFPHYAEIISSSADTIPFSHRFCNLSVQDDEGNLIKGGNNGVEVWEKQMYGLTQGFIVEIYLKQIFQKLIEQKKFTEDIFVSIFNPIIFSEENRDFLKTSYRRFIDGDYISTLHILIPKFEKIFLELTLLISGGNTDAISVRNQKSDGKQIWTETKMLSEDFLSIESVQEVWGKDLCEQIKFVFFNSLGYKLRHKVAHGEIGLNDLNFENSILVIYFYIVLATRIKPL